MKELNISDYLNLIKAKNKDSIAYAIQDKKVLFSDKSNIVFAGGLGSGRTINLRNILYFQFLRKNNPIYIIDIYRNAEDYNIFRNQKNITFINNMISLKDHIKKIKYPSTIIIEEYSHFQKNLKKDREHKDISQRIDKMIDDRKITMIFSVSSDYKETISNNLKEKSNILIHMMSSNQDIKFFLGEKKGVTSRERGKFKIDLLDQSYGFPNINENIMIHYLNFLKNKKEFIKNIKQW